MGYAPDDQNDSCVRAYLKRRRTYICPETGSESVELADVLPQKLTLNQRFIHNPGSYQWRWRHRVSNETLFNEAQLVPPRIRLMDLDLPPRGSSSIDGLLRTIEEVVVRDWDPDQFHVVMHSSGYDSRLLSAMLRRLYKEQRIDGEVLFVCTQIEGGPFKQIMKFEGWKPSQYIVYNERAHPQEYFADSLHDFEGAWHRLGGIARLPVNLFWYTVAGLQRAGSLPPDEHIDMWYTQFSDILLSQLGGENVQLFERMWNRFYYHTIRGRPFKCAREFSPWLSHDVIRAVAGLPEGAVDRGKLDSPKFRFALCEQMLPGLGLFRNVHAMGDEGREISLQLIAAVREAYDKSWYGQQVAPDIAGGGTTQFGNYWEHWVNASLCEHAISEGHVIS